MFFNCSIANNNSFFQSEELKKKAEIKTFFLKEGKVWVKPLQDSEKNDMNDKKCFK